MKKFTIALFISIVFSSLCLGQWQKVNVTGISWTVGRTLDACDSMTVAFSANNGAFFTNDGGKNWKELKWTSTDQYGHPNGTVVDITMIDSLNLWIGSDDGRIVTTHDGGKTWEVQFSDSDKTRYIDYIKMFNSNDGIAFGDAISFGYTNDFFFVNDNVGWAVGDNLIMKTTDSGETWVIQSGQNKGNWSSVYFVDEMHGWICSDLQSKILKTTDGGLNWEIINAQYARKIFFADTNNGWLCGISLTYQTTDGGYTWKTIGLNKLVKDFFFLNKNTGWLTAKDNSNQKWAVYKTVDAGTTVNLIATLGTETLKSIYFTDEMNGFMVGVSSYPSESFLFKTTDGGVTWTKQKISIGSASLDNVIPVNNNSGGVNYEIFVDNEFDSLFVSNDSGMLWNKKKIDQGYPIISRIRFLNNQTGFLAGYNLSMLKTVNGGDAWDLKYQKLPTSGVVLKTTDGGKNWQSMNQNLIGWASADDWKRIDFVNPDVGFFSPFSHIYDEAVASKVHQTNDGGTSWNLTSRQEYSYLLKFYNPLYGFAVNQSQSQTEFARTTDGGNSWQSFYLPQSGWPADLEFLPKDSSKIWFSNMTGLYYSVDLGEHWASYGVSPQNIRDIHFVNNKVGWFLADNGNIYKTTNNGGIPTDVKSGTKVIPTVFELHQNYPNPFNPSTTITYDLPSAGFVLLKIYDFLGREIKTLVNDYQQAGSYHKTFSTAELNLSSGVYLYQLRAGASSRGSGQSLIQTKKMVLMK